jgi:hypothetical protein
MRVGSRDWSGSRVRSVWARVSRSTCAEQPVVDPARPLGQPCELAPAERRHLGAHAELVARQPVGHTEADEALDGPPRAPAARDRRAQAERLAELAQVDHGRFAFAPQHGQAP